jgi:putative ABC transport system ATP-binding protein
MASELNITKDDVIEAIGLEKSYTIGEDIYPILKGVNLKVRRGEMLALMGPSGSGKSTLLNILGVLDTVDKGEYYLEGELVTKDLDLAKIRNQKVGFIFQTFNLIPRISIVENVEVPMIYAGISIKKRKERAIMLLEKVGLGHRLKNQPNQLSGGERQRVAIARALANNPSIIFADEPTGNLDSKTGDTILNLLQDLNKNEGVTFVVVTHDEHISKICDRIVRILDGKIEQ